MRSIYKFIPYEKLKLETSLSHEEVLKKLSDSIEPGKAERTFFTRTSSSKKYFEGGLHPAGFEINRIISYKNSFLPKIEGEIETLRFGCNISLKLKCNMFVMVFISIWLTGVLIACIALIAVYLSKPTIESNFPTGVPFLMLIVGYAAIIGGFKYESIKARKYLKKILKAEEVEEFS